MVIILKPVFDFFLRWLGNRTSAATALTLVTLFVVLIVPAWLRRGDTRHNGCPIRARGLHPLANKRWMCTSEDYIGTYHVAAVKAT